MQTIILNIFIKFQTLFLSGPASWVDKLFEGPVTDNLTSIFDTSEFQAPVNGLYLVLNGTGGESIYASLWSTIQSLVTRTLMPIGIALVSTYFILSIIDMASKDNTTLEHYIKEFIKLIIAVTVVSKSWPIILYLLKIGESILSEIDNGVSYDLENAAQNILDDHESFGGYIALWFTSILPWLVKKISVLALYVCVFMRALDVTWRAAMFPIGSANLFDNGVNSPGVRYIKSFFGTLLSGAMVMLILVVSPPLLQAAYQMAGGTENAGAGMLAIAGAELAIVGAAFGASNKVKEAFM